MASWSLEEEHSEYDEELTVCCEKAPMWIWKVPEVDRCMRVYPRRLSGGEGEGKATKAGKMERVLAGQEVVKGVRVAKALAVEAQGAGGESHQVRCCPANC